MLRGNRRETSHTGLARVERNEQDASKECQLRAQGSEDCSI